MRNRGGVILLVIFLVLAGIVYLQDQGVLDNSQAPIATPALTRVFPDLAVLDILAIQLEFPGTELVATFAREPDGTWIRTESDQAIDPNLGTSIARTLVLLPYTRTIPLPGDNNMTQYGFGDTPQFLISALTEGGNRLSVGIGDPLQTGPSFYGIVSDRDELYVLQRAPIDYLVSLVVSPSGEENEESGESITP